MAHTNSVVVNCFIRVQRNTLSEKSNDQPRDGNEYVVTFLPDNIVALRHSQASELRRMCHTLRWEIVTDTVPDPNDLASW